MARQRGLLADEGTSELLLGNEAIVRGALEAGVAFATGYPGTPSSEITDGFARLAALQHGTPCDVRFEYAVNEKIAVELAFGASLAGARSLAAMKHLGLSYAGDPLSTIPYIGTTGGLVVVSAGDPGCHTSPNEQDQRHLGVMLHLPVLDPSTPDEALRMTRFAFELSESSELPVLLRPTTRVCQARAPVRLGELRAPVVRGFVRDPARRLPVPANARRLRGEIEERMVRARRKIVEERAFFSREGAGRRALLTSGAAAAVCADLLRGLDGELALLRVGVVHPLPAEWLLEELGRVDELLVVEELSPFLEDAVRALCQLHRLPTRVLGQRTGHVPAHGELGRELVARSVEQAFGVVVEGARRALPVVDEGALVARPPILCAGCPHRSAFFAVKAAFGDGALMFNDIGCYTLGAAPPFSAGDALLCMGAGITLAAGASRVTGQRTVAFIGDSTFFHSGMPALLDVVKERADVVTVVLDNEVTAMTGFQESPLIEVAGGRVERRVDIEAIVRALGVGHVERVDPYQSADTLAAFERARDGRGPSVVILERPCPVFLERELARARAAAVTTKTSTVTTTAAVTTKTSSTKAQVDAALCRSCGRAALGHRCHQPATIPFERQLAHARGLEQERDPPAPRLDVAPCATSCPLFLCVQGYATHIAAGENADALELILDGLPLPDSVCRVCHRPCEDVCVRAATDEPVAINDLKRFVVEWANETGARPPLREAREEHERSVAVVGAGPAGLSAAYDLRMRGYRVALFEARAEAGGLLRHGIPEYRLPKAAVARDVARVLDAGVELHGGRALGRELSLGGLLEQHEAVVVALGAGRPIGLTLEGDGPAAVVDALAYLERAGEGTAARVLVVGGGNAAIDAARTALRHGAAVTLACLEARADMPALVDEVEAAVREGVVLADATRVVKKSARGVVVGRVERQHAGRTDPGAYALVPGSERELDVEQLIIAIGQRPELAALDGLARTAGGRLAVDDDGRTSHPRVFAAGDLVELEQTVTGAVASGRRAAWGVDRALRGAEAADRRPPPPRPQGSSTTMVARRTDHRARARPGELPVERRARSFAEVAGRLSDDDARREAGRCLACGLCGNCGACLDVLGCPAFYLDDGGIRIDAALCIDCRVCVATCANGAIA